MSVRGEPTQITPSPTSIVINKRVRARACGRGLDPEQARDKRLKATTNVTFAER